MTDEEWRPVLGYEGSYEVSDQGRVRSVTRVIACKDGRARTCRGRVLTPKTDSGGRLQVQLCHGGKRYVVRRIHRLVLESFIGPRPPGMEGCHNDGDHLNNRLSNLRWDTRSGNMRDALRHGTHFPASRTHCSAGHPFDDVYFVKGAQKRRCRICHNKRARERMRRNYVPWSAEDRCPGTGRRTLRGRIGERDRCPVCNQMAYVRVDGTTGSHRAQVAAA